ncbi:hypothetical protein NC651_004571 [Populus alba x Populus x berolinensis]|nr:hypothetical protein NC651_004571 [Populus alba x Populus x berolinensis]
MHFHSKPCLITSLALPNLQAKWFTLIDDVATLAQTSSTRPKDAMPMDLHRKVSSLEIKRLSRRMVLKFCGFNTLLLSINPVLAAPMPEMKEPEVTRTLKLANGVRFQEIIEGEGPEAQEGDTVEVNYVCRRSNGYFVHSTVDQFSGESSPVILPLDENQIIKGLKEVLIGMKVRGKRRALIPPSVGYFGPRRSLLSHANEPLIFEVQLLKSWFSSSGEDQQQEKPPSSLFADWNSYAATSDANESTNGLGSFGSFDLEAAVRSANDTVSGTFNVMLFTCYAREGADSSIRLVACAFADLYLPILVPKPFAMLFLLAIGRLNAFQSEKEVESYLLECVLNQSS